MKVLWFTNTPSLAESALQTTVASGGWIKSLEQTIRDTVQLSVAFYHTAAKEPFTIANTTYYPILSGRKGLWGKIRQRAFHELEQRSDTERFLEIIRRVQPDLIHIHGSEGPFGLVARLTNIPVVISIQGIVSVCAKKYFSGISRQQAFFHEPPKRRLLLNTYTNQYKRFTRQALREEEILAAARHLIGRTEWDRRVTSVLSPDAQYYHLDEVLRDGFYQHEWSVSVQGNPKLFTTTGPNLFKGLETLLFCSSLLDGRNVQYTWYVAGISANDQLVKLALSALRIPLSPNIVFTGVLREQELIGHLLESNLYIGISHIENSPNSLCEALILGVPCISTFAGGTSSLLEDRKEGLLVQDGDSYSMAGAILEQLKAPEAAAAMGRAARHRALERHNPETIRENLLHTYRTIIRLSTLKPTNG